MEGFGEWQKSGKSQATSTKPRLVISVCAHDHTVFPPLLVKSWTCILNVSLSLSLSLSSPWESYNIAVVTVVIVRSLSLSLSLTPSTLKCIFLSKRLCETRAWGQRMDSRNLLETNMNCWVHTSRITPRSSSGAYKRRNNASAAIAILWAAFEIRDNSSRSIVWLWLGLTQWTPFYSFMFTIQLTSGIQSLSKGLFNSEI